MVHILNIKNRLKTLSIVTLISLAHCDMPKKGLLKSMPRDTIEFIHNTPPLKLNMATVLSDTLISGKYLDDKDFSSAKNLIKSFEGAEEFSTEIKGQKYYQVYYGKADQMADNIARKRGFDIKNLLTVGHGHAKRGYIELSGGKKLKTGDLITENQADSLIDSDLKGKQDTLQLLLRTKISNNEKDAILSYMFNVDWKKLAISDSTRKIPESFFECLNKNKKGMVQSKFNIIDAGGIIHQGLVKRRLVEMAIYGNGEIYKDPYAQENFTTLVKKLNPEDSKSSIKKIGESLKNYGIEPTKIEKFKEEILSILHPQN